MDKKILLNNVSLIHSTVMGIERISKNMNVSPVNALNYCISIVNDINSTIYKKGKNWYIENNDVIITINSYNYCIITAHKK